MSLPGAGPGRAYSADVAVEGMPGRGSEEFLQAVQDLRAARLRREVRIEEVPAPQRIAPFAVALAAEVEVDGEQRASGRFVLLHDPAGQEAWQGRFRAVTLVRAEMEPETGTDPMLAGVGWSWLVESLAAAGASCQAPGGTVTRVLSDSFGSLQERAGVVEMEIRASWTPVGPGFQAHLAGWSELLCTVAGLPPLPAGVAVLPRRRG